MEIRPIRTAAQYREALKIVASLIDADPKPRSPDADKLEILAMLVESYEAKHHPIDPPDPIEAIKFRMDQAGLTVKDMAEYIGPPNRVYEVLNGKRPLTLDMIRRLVAGLGMQADVLISATVQTGGGAAPVTRRHRGTSVAA